MRIFNKYYKSVMNTRTRKTTSFCGNLPFFNDIRSCRNVRYSQGYDICYADDIRFAYEWNGYYITLVKQVYHAALPYITSPTAIYHQEGASL